LNEFIPFYSVNDIDKRDRLGTQATTLIYACEQAQFKTVDILLSYTADHTLADRKGDTALHKAARCGDVKIVELLLAKTANPNAPNVKGWTPLHVACQETNVDIVKALLKSGAKATAVMEENLTCVGIAMMFSTLEIVKILLESIPVKLPSDDALNEAIEYVRSIQDLGGPLVHALHFEKVKVAKTLMECRVQYVNAQDHYGETALHKSCYHGYFKVAKQLIDDFKCDINIVSDLEYSPYHVAVANQHPRIVDLLTERGAKISVPTVKFAEEILLKAAASGYLNIFKQMLEFRKTLKLDIDVRDNEGNTPLLLAAQNTNTKICRLLLVEGADVTSRNFWGVGVFDTNVPKKLFEEFDYVRKVQQGLANNDGHAAMLGMTPGVTPGMVGNDATNVKYGSYINQEDDEPNLGLAQ